MVANTFGTALLFVAFLFLVIVSLSTPIGRDISFLDADLAYNVFGDRSSSTLSLGAWGYCYAQRCSARAVGWNLDALTNVPAIARIQPIARQLTYGLFMNSVAAFFTLIAFGFSAAAPTEGPAVRVCATLSSAVSLLATTAALVVDLTLFIIMRIELEDFSSHIRVDFGVAMYLVIVAVGCQLLSILTVCCIGHAKKREQQLGVQYADSINSQTQLNRDFHPRAGSQVRETPTKPPPRPRTPYPHFTTPYPHFGAPHMPTAHEPAPHK